MTVVLSYFFFIILFCSCFVGFSFFFILISGGSYNDIASWFYSYRFFVYVAAKFFSLISVYYLRKQKFKYYFSENEVIHLDVENYFNRLAFIFLSSFLYMIYWAHFKESPVLHIAYWFLSLSADIFLLKSVEKKEKIYVLGIIVFLFVILELGYVFNQPLSTFFLVMTLHLLIFLGSLRSYRWTSRELSVTFAGACCIGTITYIGNQIGNIFYIYQSLLFSLIVFTVYFFLNNMRSHLVNTPSSSP
ncbi:MAG: hypothetical protein H6621_02855 [Halobacteriovoraceae bacterium]|nr:hypothetical protein [Halobacteriovoraceae bacterium]MCB9093984.1 hypothetical protein [Halobacteriovoraceae bacterium]